MLVYYYFTVIITGDTPLKRVSCASLQLDVYMLILSRSLASINKKICLTMHLMSMHLEIILKAYANKSGMSYSIYKYDFIQ